MQERSPSPSLGNMLMFVVVLVLTFLVYPWARQKFFPPPPAVPQNAQAQNGDKAPAEKKAADKKAAENKVVGEKRPEKPSDHPKWAGPGEEPKGDGGKAAKPTAPAEKVAPAPQPKRQEPRQWVTLGSADPDPSNPFRMLVTLSNEGGSVARVELSSERYRDLEDRGGYLGHLVMDNTDRGPGCLVQVVGEGTPAAAVDLKPGDQIVKLEYQGQPFTIDGPTSLELALRSTKPEKTITLTLNRGNEKGLKKDVVLIRRPLEVIRPERKKPSLAWIPNGPFDAIDVKENSPLSFLTTLQSVDEKNPNNLPPDISDDAKWEEELNREMPGVALRDSNWQVEPETKSDRVNGVRTRVVFSCPVPEYHLTLTKTYQLVEVEGDPASEADARAYHLVLSVQIINHDTKTHEVAYRLDGPNGLPVEGSWYATSKVGRTWSAEGLRDVVYQMAKSETNVATATQLSDKFFKDIGEATTFNDHPPQFFGVDAQYFSVAMLPDAKSTTGNLERAVALRVGDVVELRKTLTNTTFRLISKPLTLEPNGGKSPPQTFEVFAGPKRPPLLAQYGLSSVICYGWQIFEMVAKPMTKVLDFFYLIVHNYGLAIIMLTIVVRLAFFPVSRKQAQTAQLMQRIQPKLKELEKKHKGDWKALQAARQELLAKYNYNPSAGCLLLLLQLPVFMGLYRALQVNVELRGAPLLSSSIRWCSNLAAPDMLFDWSRFMPDAVNNGVGFPWFPLFGTMLGAGPYLNLFPVITIVLFLVQQKVMMPPAADEQAAQQQKIMKYVMFLMGFMFFKVAAGLCIYFIATTLWGLGERQFLPKSATAEKSGEEGESTRAMPKVERTSSAEREAIRRKKFKGKK